jgi:hypothetical protein
MSGLTGVVAPGWAPRRGDALPTSDATPLLAHDHRFSEGSEPEPDAEEEGVTGGRSAPARWPERGLAGLATAGLAAWVVANLVPSAPLAPLAAAVLAGIVVAALPRLGWLAFVFAVVVWLSFAGRTGAALVVGLGGVLPALLVPWRATAWGLPVAAPALGAIGLAGAWPALAGRGRGPLTRAALGAVGWVWTALGTALSGATLYLPAAPGTPPAGQWPASVGATLHHVLTPLVSSGALAPALVWAAAAMVLPWLVRGRRLALDFVLASAWAAGLVAATYTSIRMVHGSLSGAPVRGAVIGGVAAFALALAPSVLQSSRAGRFFARVP